MEPQRSQIEPPRSKMESRRSPLEPWGPKWSPRSPKYRACDAMRIQIGAPELQNDILATSTRRIKGEGSLTCHVVASGVTGAPPPPR